MSQVSTTQVRYWPYRARAACPSAAIRATQLSPTLASGEMSAEFSHSLWGGNMPSQHHGLSFFAKPPTAMPSGSQVQSHHQTRVPSGVGQAHTCQGTGGGHHRDQIAFHPQHGGARPVNDMTAYPPHGPHGPHHGGQHSFHPGHNTPMTYRPNIPRRSSVDSHSTQNSHQRVPAWHTLTTQSLSAYALQSSWQVATPQQSPPSNQDLLKLSSIITQSPLPAPMIFEDASPIDTSPAESKETPLATETCPFPQCNKVTYRRPQELERHVREYHLPYDLYCEQEGCNWTGNRRYALQNHVRDKHPLVPMPEQEAFTIYDAKGLVKQLLGEEITVEQAVGKARSLFQKKAAQLGKLGNRRWMRGLKVSASL